MRRFAQYWRDSASLLVLARHGSKTAECDGYNYKVLAFKRSANMAFMPKTIVFPGGAFDQQQDAPLAWNHFLTAQRNIPQATLDELTRVSGVRPYLFQNESNDVLDRNISLRLCALREAFEELGILLHGPGGPSESGYSSALSSFDVPANQTAVHQGKKTFLELYRELNTAPDLWNLYEWSTWLTPTMFRKRRFETAFFLAALNEQPEVFPEKHEVTDWFWDTPRALLDAHKAEEIWLGPPQMYELTRLSHVRDIDTVVAFARKRNKLGSTVICPMQYSASDAKVFVLPGDDLYPKDYDLVTPHTDEKKYEHLSVAEMRQMVKNLHRSEHTNQHSQTFHHNIVPLDGHLSVLGGDVPSTGGS